jgi:hypothetical protein
VVNNLPDRGICINSYPCGRVFSGCMQVQNQRALIWLCAKLIAWALRQSPVQGVEINIQNKDRIEEVDKMMKVSGAAAKEKHCNAFIRNQCFDFADIPDVMLVARPRQRFARLRIPLIGQGAITMNGMISTPQKLIAHRGLAAARNTFNQIISNAHRLAPLQQWALIYAPIATVV